MKHGTPSQANRGPRISEQVRQAVIYNEATALRRSRFRTTLITESRVLKLIKKAALEFILA